MLQQKEGIQLLYKDKFQAMPILCLSCANTFEHTTRERLKCPICSTEMSRSQYEDFYRYSFQSIRYGYQYRKAISKENSENEKPKQFYLLPPDQILIYLGLAAVSGIVGNLATDLVKKVMRLIVDRNRGIDQKNSDTEPSIDFDELYQSIEVHFNNYNGIDEKLIDEIEEENAG
jgi:hypothetical protein